LKNAQTNIDAVKREIGVTGMTIKELTSHIKEQQFILNNMDPNLPAYKLLQQEIKECGDRVAELRGKAKGVGADLASSGNVFTKFFGSMTAKLKEWGSTVAMYFSVQAIFGFFKDGISASIKMADAQKLLLMALDNNKAKYNELIKFRDKLANSTKYTKTEITEAEKFLAIQGRTTEQTKKLMQAAAELSTVTGKDLNESVKQLDGTYSGIVNKSIKRLGEEFRGLSTEQAKNGEVIDVVLKKYGGKAAEELETTGGRIAMLQKAWEGLKRTVGDVFTNSGSGYFNGAISGLTSFINLIKNNLNVVIAIGKGMVSLAAAVTSYKLVISATAIVEKIGTIAKGAYNTVITTFNNLTKSSILLSKEQQIQQLSENKLLLQAAINKIAVKDATKAAEIAMIAETDATEAATMAQRSLNAAQKANLWGLIIAIVIAAGTALWEYYSKISDTVKKQQELDNALSEANKKFGEQRFEMDELFDKLKKTNSGTEERKRLVDELNTEYGQYLPNLLTEKSSLIEINNAQELANKSLYASILLDVKKEKIKAKIVERSEQQQILDKANADLENANNTRGPGAYDLWEAAFNKQIAAKNKIIELDTDIAETDKFFNKEILRYSPEITKKLENIVDFKKEMSAKSLEELETLLANSKQMGEEARHFDKDQESALRQIIASKKKAQKEEISDFKKYSDESKKLQEEFHALADTDFTDSLSKYQKEIKAVHDKYTKLIAEEKKYIDEVSKLDPKTRKLLQPDVDQRKDNIKILEVEQNAQYDKIVLEAEQNLATEVLDIHKKLERAKMSLQEQAIQDINDKYDKMVLDASIAETTAYEAKLKALNDEVADQETKDKELEELNKQHTANLKKIQDQTDIVNAERARQTAETNKQFEEKSQKDKLELYKRYHLFDENSEIESDRKAALQDLESHKLEFKTEADYLAAKQNINADFDKKELDAKKALTTKKIEEYKRYFESASKIENELSSIVSNLKEMDLQKAGDNEEKKKAINKKYADIEMAITIAKIITDTAQAAMSSYAEGGIVGEVFAALAITAGAVEIDLAVQQRNKIKGLETGLYPDYMLTTRAQDGKQFNAKVNRYPYSQLVNEPSLLVGEQGKKGMPEAILDGLVMKDLQMNSPVIIAGLKQSIERVHGTAPGFENGFYDNMNLNRAMQPGLFSKEDIEVMKEFNATMRHVATNGVKGNWNMYDFDVQKGKYDRDKAKFSS